MGVQVLAYDLIKDLSSSKRIEKIFNIVKNGDVVMLEGRIAPEEESELISKALASVSGKFTGIEVAFLNSKFNGGFLEKIKNSVINILAKERMGITVVGPSKIIGEIKMDPQKLEILFK